MNTEIRERLTRARIQLQRKQPFFAYLVLRLEMIETKEVPTIAVDNYNHLYYNPDWLKPLSDGQLEMLLCHETLHLAFEHLVRNGTRNHLLFNCATDICINNILVNNKFKMVSCGIIPKNNEIDFAGVHIIDIDKKSAEAIYDELSSKVKQNPKNNKLMESSRFDGHITDDLKAKSNGTEEEQKQAKEIKENLKKWKELLTEASAHARNKGQIPAGMDLHIDNLLESRVDWKTLLYKFVTNNCLSDYSYSRPSRRSQACGFYMPHMTKEEINVMVAIDTSGSIQQAELTEFVSEIVYMAKSFNNIKMKVIFCDAEVKGEVLEVENGNIQKILDAKIQGGGGTSFKVPLDYVQEKYNDSKLVIFFTDGYGDRISQDDYSFKLLWVLCEKGSDDIIKDEGIIIKLSN